MTLNTIRIAIIALMLLPVVGTTSSDVRAQTDSVRLLTTNSMGSQISIVDPATGDADKSRLDRRRGESR
jgi:hypothetical protein